MVTERAVGSEQPEQDRHGPRGRDSGLQCWAGRRPHAPGPRRRLLPHISGRAGWGEKGVGGGSPRGRCVRGSGLNSSQLRELPALPGGARCRV